ncbi:MAG: N-acetyltransferase [Actinobacteria bacterium]|nr:N-acetyltransferase [Actinomycetota bacterium]
MIEVVDRPSASRYEALLDGTVVGECTYRITDHGVLLPHIEVRPDLNGQGIGSTLARRTLDDLRRRHLTVIPICPFMVHFIRVNPEYADLVHAG